MDFHDRASEVEDTQREEALARQARAAALEQPGDRICSDCGTEIPLARRRALPSARRCVDCQEWAEHLARVPA
jgi:phage/conjugal plasmid C-4 type zinc finger TraR family protein